MKKILVLAISLLTVHNANALSCVNLSSNIFRYEESESVQMLQNFFFEKEYLKTQPNGYFGPGTLSAVKEYQAANGIKQTGVVGPTTRALLKKTTCGGDDGAVTPPSTSPKKEETISKKEEVPSIVQKNTTVPLPTKVTCFEIKENLTVGTEAASVTALQEFLYVKGYLTSAPNGYFGPATYKGVASFQKESGITQTGTVGPLTREKLRLSSCGSATAATSPAGIVKASTTFVQAEKKITTTAAPSSTEGSVVSVSSKNQKRWNDSEAILRALYQYIGVSRGTWSSKASSTVAIELCSTPRVTEMASSAEVAVLITQASLCKDVVDISSLTPGYIATIPRDPTLATTSVMTGYTIIRGEYGDVTISPKITDNKEVIRVRCYFNQGCTSITKISNEEYGVPFVTTLSRTVLLRDSLPKEGITITGRNFTSSNTVFFQSKGNQRIYEIGTFVSADGKTFTIAATTTKAEISCGSTCREKLPIGDYSVQIKNQGGESNISYVSVKGFTTSSIESRADTTVTASSTNVKLGTITVSTSLPGTLKSLTLRSTSTSPKLGGKITNFKLKDLISNTTISGSGLTFDLTSTSLPENSSRYYDLYADVGNVLVDEAGHITYGGEFLLRDTLGGVDIELPIKEISFSASPYVTQLMGW